MSTRSGKRIHISFNENTEKTEALLTRSVKTKSKHTKENLDALNVSPKIKRLNYVAYPSEEDTGVDTVDSKGDGKKTRVLRKDALKERNFSSTESVEPAVDMRKSMRSTRRTRKFAENAEDAMETPQDEELTKAELPKPKKDKKKKKKAEKEPLAEVEVETKKKSKKKKSKRSGSIVVEDIIPEASSLNKSNMSVDSFHSAAGSPRNTDIATAPLQDIEQVVDTITTTAETKSLKSQARKTRSSLKLDYTLTNDKVIEKEPKIQKLSVEMNHDGSIRHDDTSEKEKDSLHKTPNRELRKRKNTIKDTVSTDTVNTYNLEEKLSSTRKSIRNQSFDKTITPNKSNTTFENDDANVTSANKGKKRKSISDKIYVNKDLKADEETVLNTIETEAATESAHRGKKRKSARKSANETSVREEVNVSMKEKKSITNASFDTNENSSPFKSSTSKFFEDETQHQIVNTTYEKDSTDSESIQDRKKSIVDATFDLTSSPFKSANEVSSPLKITEDLKRKSVINTTYEKDSDTDQDTKKKSINTTFDKDVTETKINTTFEKDTIAEINNKRKSLRQLSVDKITDSFDIHIDQDKKLDTTFDKSSKSSLISSDNSIITLDKSDASRISITSDESKENILNTTPLLIESSLDESQLNTTKTHSLKETTSPKSETKTQLHSSTDTTPPKMECQGPITPLKREGTFTKDEPEVKGSPKPKLSISKTPTKHMSLPSAGFTPFHVNKSSTKEKSVLLNITRSIEKRRSSLAEPSRTTKVMFCSPVDNPALLTQNRKKVIKSNLKGSNKSFVFDESLSLDTRPSNRKRSYTQSDADDASVKRKRLADELQQSVDRLSRPRTSSASAKLAEPTTPSKKSDVKKSIPRTKLPNFAAMHQKQFDKMESLDECQERRAKRAKQLLTPNGATNMLERISPKDKVTEPEKPKEAPKKPETPIKSLPTFKSLNPGFTRFGFKLNLDVNPFSIPAKTQPKPKENKPNLIRKALLPSLVGATSASVRREAAKQTVMREKSFNNRRSVKRTENRTVIKGVRTNRRFELQMAMRDI